MYPVLFRIGSLEITSFGAMLAVASVTGLWLFRREVERSRLPASTVDAALFGLVGGIVGAKIVWSIEHLSEAPFLDSLLSRGGLSWFGGLVGGVGTGVALLVRQRVSLLAALAAATPAFAFGHLLGRIGCFLVGDDYGIPTELPWAVAFPEGLPPTYERVHPTQLYEAIGLGVLGWLLLRWRRDALPDAHVLGRYLLIAGALRFSIEFIRVHDEILPGIAVAHLFSLAMMCTGAILLLMKTSPRGSSKDTSVTRPTRSKRRQTD